MGRFRRKPEKDPEVLREAMVSRQIERRGVSHPDVLRAMREVPREIFVPSGDPREAYSDHALPIGHGQTISQPYIVASMTEKLEPEPGRRVLEIGTGSGYQSAVLAACGLEVFSVERIAALSRRARASLEEAGYADRVRLRVGDGSRGWPEHAPYDRILLTAGAAELPEPLVDQLAPDGIIVAPVGGRRIQHIRRYRKGPCGGLEEEKLEGARFVPLVRSEAGADASRDDAERGDGS